MVCGPQPGVGLAEHAVAYPTLLNISAALHADLQSKHQKQDAAAAQRNMSMKQQLYALRQDKAGQLPSPQDVVRKAEVGEA